MTRPAAVAGSFYPSHADDLERVVRRLLADAPQLACRRPKALVVPHAGFAYSGPVAASGFSTLRGESASIRRVVLIGPSHYMAFSGVAVSPAGAFETPLGRVPLDAELGAKIARLPQVTVGPEAHRLEHCLEVELPFLQTVLGPFELLPLVVGDCDAAGVAEVLEAAWGDSSTLIVVSSDLSHYLTYEEARVTDAATATQIVEHRWPVSAQRACGAQSINGLLCLAEQKGLDGRLLDLRSSGDTGGDRRQVVGYGAFSFSEVA